MKKAFVIFALIMSANAARAACEATTKTYTSCKPGYYLEDEDCKPCPSDGGASATSADKNSGGKTDCYIPAGATGSDASGNFRYDGNSYYCG